MAVSGRPGVALIQAKAADKHLALFVEGKFQVHAGHIVRAAGEAVVLAEAHTVTASMMLRRHRREILYRPPNVGASVWLVRQRSRLVQGWTPQGCHPERSLSSREARRKQAKDPCIPRHLHILSTRPRVQDHRQIWREVWSPRSSGMHGSFVGSPSLREGLHFLRMTVHTVLLRASRAHRSARGLALRGYPLSI